MKIDQVNFNQNKLVKALVSMIKFQIKLNNKDF